MGELSVAALNSRLWRQSELSKGNSGSIVFNQLLTKMDNEGMAGELSRKYGLSVGLEAIPKSEQEIVKRGRSGTLKDVTIAPGIVDRMKGDPALRAKVEGHINDYVNIDLPSFKRMENMYGVTLVASSIIIHDDGTRTVWSASITSPEEVEKGKKMEEVKRKEKEKERARLMGSDNDLK